MGLLWLLSTLAAFGPALLEYIEIDDKATILDLQKMHTGVYVILGVRYLKRALQKFQDDRAAFSLTLRHNID